MQAEHFGPLAGLDRAHLLILARDDVGAGHFLDGHPVHAGTPLELLTEGQHWQPITYEWSWDPDRPPSASIALGTRPRSTTVRLEAPVASFELPASAILRWPPR